jgi:glycosyltransferase 2 family protein
MTKARLWTALQAVLLIATLAWVARALAQRWDALRTAAAATTVHWGWIALASLIVLATYGMLIQSWRMLLAGWGSSLRFSAAIRIWTIANLGRYIPGKVWSIGALGVLAKREGVSGVSAAGAAILGTMLNIGTGLGIIALSSARVLAAFKTPWLQTVAVVASIAFVIGTLLLPLVLPPVLDRFARWRGLPALPQHLPATTIWASTAINAVSWVSYGLAFALFARGVAPGVIATPALFIVIWTASYVGGYLVLYAPGGIGAREAVMGGGLVALGLATAGDATLLTIASRLWLTVLEILPGLLALAFSPLTARAATQGDP